MLPFRAGDELTAARLNEAVLYGGQSVANLQPSARRDAFGSVASQFATIEGRAKVACVPGEILRLLDNSDWNGFPGVAPTVPIVSVGNSQSNMTFADAWPVLCLTKCEVNDYGTFAIISPGVPFLARKKTTGSNGWNPGVATVGVAKGSNLVEKTPANGPKFSTLQKVVTADEWCWLIKEGGGGGCAEKWEAIMTGFPVSGNIKFGLKLTVAGTDSTTVMEVPFDCAVATMEAALRTHPWIDDSDDLVVENGDWPTSMFVIRLPGVRVTDDEPIDNTAWTMVAHTAVGNGIVCPNPAFTLCCD